ncbi:MAG: extracellular solute-binding protein [Patescibacteria group bacterium]|nr:extracellular solute-binding protein [Patescibacteria group bacterium]
MKIVRILILVFIIFSFLFGWELGAQIPGQPQPRKPILPPVNLSWWVVWEQPSDFTDLINTFRTLYPYVNIEVKKFRYEEYREALIEAWARDVGPDIFSLPNTWLREYQEWIVPMPAKVALKKEIQSGPSCARKTKIITEEKPLLTLKDLKEKFVGQVEKDVLIQGRIAGLPLSFDTLVLYYNRDLLDAAGIPEPPKTWEEFMEAVIKTTLIDKQKNIFQAGAALGTANNIERAVDLLSLLMMQSGINMTNPQGLVTFNQAWPDDPSYFPAEEALRFYTDFADKNKEVYTWHKEMPSNLEMFIQGKLVFFFGYAYHLPLIKAQAPNLNFGLTKMPQRSGTLKEINFAHYPVQVVSRKSKNIEMAWFFLNWASQNPTPYLNRAKKPTALRSLIAIQLQDPDLEVFASQALTASSWYQGKNPLLVEEAFKEMIDDINEGRKSYLEAINFAVQKINQQIK